MSDLISRAAVLSLPRVYAKNSIGKIFKEFINVKDVEALPAAQLEIIRCRDCMWFGEPGCAIEILDSSDKPKENDFCSFAERKSNDE